MLRGCLIGLKYDPLLEEGPEGERADVKPAGNVRRAIAAEQELRKLVPDWLVTEVERQLGRSTAGTAAPVESAWLQPPTAV